MGNTLVNLSGQAGGGGSAPPFVFAAPPYVMEWQEDSGVAGDMWETTYNFADISQSNVQVRLTVVAKRSAGTGGKIRVRLGGTSGADDGTLMTELTMTGTSYATLTAVGTSTAKPGTTQILKVIFEAPAGNTLPDEYITSCTSGQFVVIGV